MTIVEFVENAAIVVGASVILGGGGGMFIIAALEVSKEKRAERAKNPQPVPAATPKHTLS